MQATAAMRVSVLVLPPVPVLPRLSSLARVRVQVQALMSRNRPPPRRHRRNREGPPPEPFAKLLDVSSTL
jgi:hypothetical protein